MVTTNVSAKINFMGKLIKKYIIKFGMHITNINIVDLQRIDLMHSFIQEKLI